jgi:hypothetical protein
MLACATSPHQRPKLGTHHHNVRGYQPQQAVNDAHHPRPNRDVSASFRLRSCKLDTQPEEGALGFSANAPLVVKVHCTVGCEVVNFGGFCNLGQRPATHVHGQVGPAATLHNQMWVTPWGPCEVRYCPLGSPLVLRSGYEWRGCPQAVSRESHRTRNKNKQTNQWIRTCLPVLS